GTPASHVEHGEEDHDRLRKPHEQGPGGDRGALALRRPPGPRGYSDASAEYRSLAGRLRRQLDQGAARAPRYAPPDPVRSEPPRALAECAGTPGPRSRGRADVRRG